MPQIGTFPFRMPGRASNPACQTLSRACPRQVTGPNKPTVFAGETVGFCIVRGGVKSPVCGLDVPGKGTNCNLMVCTAPTVGAARSRPQRNEIECSVEWYRV